ncbi:MAG TPA: hypothetical protein VME17_05175 [Bryobacteraceae bacterium]|nr:hypothetical protein [Bryobacteraceae bacterium]
MKMLVLLVLLACAASAQSIIVQVGGRPVGNPRAALNLNPGAGVLEACTDDGATANRITCTPSFNSSIISTHDTVHTNENFCTSTNGTTQYTCHLPYKALTSYQTGMTFVLDTDAPCTASCSLNIDSVGAVSIKRSDGKTDPGPALAAGEPQWVFYDGNVFRLMGNGGGGGAPAPVTAYARAAPGDARDSIARRFIASMETMTYAKSVMLETTAGDLHKTTTSNGVGNATINAATPGLPGQHMWIIIANDQLSAKTVTFGSNFKSAGPLTGSPGKTATLQFISDGIVWYEVARTTNL